MTDLTELQAKLDRTQIDVDQGVWRLTEQRALMLNRLAEGKDAAEVHERLESLEATQLVYVQHRDRLRREIDAALAGRARRWASERGA